MTENREQILKTILGGIQKNLVEKFRHNFECLILYGSWVKGTAHADSDIDLLVLFDRIDKEMEKSVRDIERSISAERSITIIPSSLEDFKNERIPLYTAVKREGKIIYGNADLSINPEPPEIKYSGFFKKSYEFETQKIRVAEELLEKDLLTSGIVDLCYVASKHAIQAALAMKGEGYSSKVAVLLPLAAKYFGNEIAERFERLFGIYIKSEYGMGFLTKEEAGMAIEYAKVIQGVYTLD